MEKTIKDGAKIKVLLYSERWENGGIEAFIMNLYRNLDLSKLDVKIMTSQNETSMYDKEIETLGGEKIETLRRNYKSPIFRTIKNFKSFKDKIKLLMPDVLHLNVCHSVTFIYAYLAKKAGVKRVILHSHSTNVGAKNNKIKTFAHRVCKNIFEKYIDEYLACSNTAAEWVYTKKVLNLGKVRIINNGINVQKFIFNANEREKFRNELGISDKFVIRPYR